MTMGMEMTNWRNWFGRKWLKIFATIFCGIIIEGGILGIEANSYHELEDRHLAADEIAPRTTLPTNWQECQENCQMEPECQSFAFRPMGGTPTCYRYATTIGYGPLAYDNAITGQLVSLSPTASLAWLGIGRPDDTYTVGKVVGTSNISRSECQAECDGVATKLDGVECASYVVANGGSGDICTVATGARNELPTEPRDVVDNARLGIRTDLNFSQTAIIGDPLNTRVYPADLPAAPPDIGDAVPAYTEVPFNTEFGVKNIVPYNEVDAASVASWQECSILCHRNASCSAFVFAKSPTDTDKCYFYDVTLVGKVKPGYSKYGIIDRAGPEGAVRSLTSVVYYGTELGNVGLAYKLFTYGPVTSMEDCAKLCYHFYQPRVCGGFSFSGPTSKCLLYDVAVPCGVSGANSIKAGDIWDATKYRFGVIDGRLSDSMREDLSCCYGSPFTDTVPCPNGTTTTTTTTTTPLGPTTTDHSPAGDRYYTQIDHTTNMTGTSTSVVCDALPCESLVCQFRLEYRQPTVCFARVTLA